MEISRGDIFYADLSPVVGSEQGGVRPVIVIQNNVGNKYSPTVIVAAITSQLSKAKIPTHNNKNKKKNWIFNSFFCNTTCLKMYLRDFLFDCSVF